MPALEFCQNVYMFQWRNIQHSNHLAQANMNTILSYVLVLLVQFLNNSSKT